MSLQTAISEILSLSIGKEYENIAIRKCQEIADAAGDALKSPVDIVVSPTQEVVDPVVEPVAAEEVPLD